MLGFLLTISLALAGGDDVTRSVFRPATPVEHIKVGVFAAFSLLMDPPGRLLALWDRRKLCQRGLAQTPVIVRPFKKLGLLAWNWNDTIWVKPNRMLVSARSVEITFEELYADFDETMPARYAQIARQVVTAFRDLSKVEHFIRGLQREMVADQVDFDTVAARRAQALGFRLDADGRPFSYLGYAFGLNRLHRTASWFYDWSGNRLVANGSVHSVRGHALQLLFAATYVDGFLDLYRYIGQTNDRAGVWLHVFDNSGATATPFSAATWVEDLGPALGIDY